jgi:hypothetical protein
MNLGYSGKRANVFRVGLQVLVMKGRSVTEGLNFPQLQFRVHHQSVQSFVNGHYASILSPQGPRRFGRACRPLLRQARKVTGCALGVKWMMLGNAA